MFLRDDLQYIILNDNFITILTLKFYMFLFLNFLNNTAFKGLLSVAHLRILLVNLTDKLPIQS